MNPTTMQPAMLLAHGLVAVMVLWLPAAASALSGADAACGDADRNGFVEAGDALDIVRGSVGLRACPACICDVDASGDVSATDGMGVLFAALDLGDPLACPVCVAAQCGDGVVEGAEDCDDANTASGDGCSEHCIEEYCGDGILNDAVEECEPPSAGACDAGCRQVGLVDLTQLGTITVSVSDPRGGGSRDAEVIRDGDRPQPGTSASLRQYDTWDLDNPTGEEWVGYEYPGPQTFAQVVFQEGKHFVNGGWFEEPRIQVRRSERWVDVQGLTVSPRYSGFDDGMNFQTYTFDFEQLVGDAVRLVGSPGGYGEFVSVAELEVLGFSQTCGDGVLVAGEACDDGNSLDGDGCSAACEVEDATGLCSGATTTIGSSLALEVVAEGLERPVHVTAPPLDARRVFIVEQPGRVRVVRDGLLLDKPFLSIEDRVSFGGERGLLSLAFDPDYQRNGRFFVAYTDPDGASVLARYRRGPGLNRADPATEMVLLRIPQPKDNHNGGQIAFGPDGYLYWGLGDGGGDEARALAQDPLSLMGKMLRIDVKVNVHPYYAVPADNPAVADGDPLGLIWASGLRNPWRFSFDRMTGDLYIADVGQGAVEEIDWQPASSSGGENYGWQMFEGTQCFDPAPDPLCPSPATGFTMPAYEYLHPNGCSVTGGHVYSGCAMPDVRGRYFFADFCSAFIESFRVLSGVSFNHADHTAALAASVETAPDRVSSFGEDARGELYIASLVQGRVFRMVPGP